MNYRIFIFITVSLLLCQVTLFAKIDLQALFTDDFVAQFPSDKIYTVTEFSGNYADEITLQLINALRTKKNIQFVDYDDQKMVISESLKYSEPVFDGKYSDSMPNLSTPDYMIHGTANLQRSNLLFKQKEHLDFMINLTDLSTGITLLNISERIQYRYNPPILLLITVLVLILAIARWIIYLKRGYNVMYIIIAAMLLVTLIVVWWVL